MDDITHCNNCEALLTDDAWRYEAGVFDNAPHAFCDDGCAREWVANNFLNDQAEGIQGLGGEDSAAGIASR